MRSTSLAPYGRKAPRPEVVGYPVPVAPGPHRHTAPLRYARGGTAPTPPEALALRKRFRCGRSYLTPFATALTLGRGLRLRTRIKRQLSLPFYPCLHFVVASPAVRGVCW